jgi:hypothetical protein
MQLARRRWKMARLMAHVIKQFPFVRGIFVSGELSKGVASEEGDIDFVIITAENRLWISRTLLILFKKIVLLNSRRYFCLNHFVSEKQLKFGLRNIYSAIEIATLKPLVNIDLFEQYMEANSWLSAYLPNWRVDPSSIRGARTKGSRMQHLLESLTPPRLADRLDDFLMKKWSDLWKRRHPDLDDGRRRCQYLCLKHMSTAYGRDFSQAILDAYRARLEQYGLASASASDTAAEGLVNHG